MAADCTFSSTCPRREAFHHREKYSFPPVAMALSDYNAIRAMAGYDPITLAPGTFTTQWRATAGGGGPGRLPGRATPPWTPTGGPSPWPPAPPPITDALGETPTTTTPTWCTSSPTKSARP